MGNAVKGKSINLCLMDGTAIGCIKCTVAGWTGLAYKIPRISLASCKDEAELKQSGVYLLFGKSDDGENFVYIDHAGAEGILSCLCEDMRDSDKAYWTEAVALTTTVNSFTLAETGSLQSRLVEFAGASGCYEVKANQRLTTSSISEERQSELEDFIEQAVLAVGAMGYGVFIDRGFLE